MGLIVLKYRIFCPFSAKMQEEDFNFFMLLKMPCEDGTFFLEFTPFSLIKTQILSLEGMMNVEIQWFIVIKAFMSHYFR